MKNEFYSYLQCFSLASFSIELRNKTIFAVFIKGILPYGFGNLPHSDKKKMDMNLSKRN